MVGCAYCVTGLGGLGCECPVQLGGLGARLARGLSRGGSLVSIKHCPEHGHCALKVDLLSAHGLSRARPRSGLRLTAETEAHRWACDPLSEEVVPEQPTDHHSKGKCDDQFDAMKRTLSLTGKKISSRCFISNGSLSS